MKAFLSMIVLLTAMQVQAAIYECTSDVGVNPKPKFTIDTEIQDNFSIPLQTGSQAGCVVFRSKPELLNCYLAYEGAGQFSATSDLNAKILAVNLTNSSVKSSLTCIKQ